MYKKKTTGHYQTIFEKDQQELFKQVSSLSSEIKIIFLNQ